MRRSSHAVPKARSGRAAGYRILAVDGSKVTLPRGFAGRGWPVNGGARYPQGMVSVPASFDLFGHKNGREAALSHLGHAAEGDVIVYDRGYLSFALALAHR